MTATWIKRHVAPDGAQPKNIVMKIGLSAMLVFTLGFVLFNITRSDSEIQTQAPATAAPELPSDNRVQSGMNRIEATQRRIEAERARDAAEQLRREQSQRRSARPHPSQSLTAGEPPSHPASEIGDIAVTEEEFKLQQALRLEEVERRARSLRSDPLVKSERPTASLGRTPAEPQRSADAESPPPDAADPQQQYLANLKATLALFNDQAEGDSQSQIRPPSAPDLPLANTTPAPPGNYQSPTVLSQASDPPGWERVHEGSFLEAVLVTQLSGDFPGPVLAQVAVPFYSRDRQEILIPRGVRAVGTAAAVSDRDQARLAIRFHRLIFPDGRWLALDFRGLNQAGESGLKDQVNRHYLQLFAATGAVGVLSGLTLRGSNPYAGGSQGFRAGAGQGFGQAASQVLQRFLNRLPTITIRAGHRLRIWFTSDVLLPRPARP